jgi:predicted transcriptional regulator
LRHRTFAEVAAERTLDDEARLRVAAMSAAMQDAMRLADIRGERGLTQTDLAEVLGVTQSRISQLELSHDAYLSTLRDYVAALGGTLELRAVFPEGTVDVRMNDPRAA